MQVEEVDTRSVNHFTIPAAIAVVATFDTSARPLVARRQRDKDGRGALLARVVDHLLQIPTEAIDHLVAAVLLHLVDVAGVGCCGNHAALLRIGDGADVVMTELNEHVVARLQGVIDLLPKALADERARGASGAGCIDEVDFRLVEHLACQRCPTPHAVIVVVGILHRGVTREEDSRTGLTCRTSLMRLIALWLHVQHHRLKRCQRGMLTGHQALGGRACIHQCPEVRGMNLVAEEVILLLPTAVAVEFTPRDVVQVHIRHIEFRRQGSQPLRLRLADDVPVFIEGIARRERHQDRMCPLGMYLADVAADVIAVAIDGVLTLRALVETDNHRVGIQSGNHRTRTPLVEELTTIVVADGDQHPVARLQRLAHGRPEVGVERASRHTAQRLILHGDFPSVEEL